MKETITYEEYLELKKTKKIAIVDVRSQKEYHSSTIPGSINIPILDDETRVEVGTLYVAGKVDEAKSVGIAYASKQLPIIFQQYQEIVEAYDEILIFCSRGGMRSESIYSLLKSLRFPVLRLQGGYKSYRNYVMEHLDYHLGKVKYVTLYGLSGSGKTEILQQLNELGANVLDLEGCANHRGSLLGGIGLAPANSQKMFESLLFEAASSFNEGDIVFTEGESRRIGPVVLPEDLFHRIQTDCPVVIESPLQYRVKQIHEDYIVGADLDDLAEKIQILEKVLSKKKVVELQEELRAGNPDVVIEELLVGYYDLRYKHNAREYTETFVNTDPKECAEELMRWIQMKR